MSRRIIFSSTFIFCFCVHAPNCCLCIVLWFFVLFAHNFESTVDEKNKCMKEFQAQTVKQKRNETRISYSLLYLEFEHSAIYGMMANVHSECAWKLNAKHSGLHHYCAHYTLYPLYPHIHMNFEWESRNIVHNKITRFWLWLPMTWL